MAVIRRWRAPALSLLGILGVVIALANRPPAMTSAPSESPEQFALRFTSAVVANSDEQAMIGMLCDEGIQFHVPNMRRQMAFWSSPALLTRPHDFTVVKSVKLDREIAAKDIWKVWVGYRYTLLYEGRTLVLNNSDGVAVDVLRTERGLCAAPWAG